MRIEKSLSARFISTAKLLWQYSKTGNVTPSRHAYPSVARGASKIARVVILAEDTACVRPREREKIKERQIRREEPEKEDAGKQEKGRRSEQFYSDVVTLASLTD